MNYQLLKDVLELVEAFDLHTDQTAHAKDLNGFKSWIAAHTQPNTSPLAEPDWEGKENGRSAESAISTLLVHLNRYAKNYSKSAIYGSEFSTQEDFIYLINLKAFGAMTKMELVKKNIQDKPTGMQIINRLIANGWVSQGDSTLDKRSKVVAITQKGITALEGQMDNIRQATRIVSGNLSNQEKFELIRLLNKLNDFHHPIFQQQIDSEHLLQQVNEMYLSPQNRTA